MLDKAGKKYYYDLENMQLDKDDIEELKTYLTPQSITFISNLQENKNHNIPFDNNNSQVIIKEVEETKKKILSLMERVNKDSFRMCKNDDFDTTEENVSGWPSQIPSLLDYGTISCIKRIKNKDTAEIVALFRREDNANYFWAKTFESEKEWEVIREIPEWAHQYILPYDPNEGWIAVKTS